MASTSSQPALTGASCSGRPMATCSTVGSFSAECRIWLPPGMDRECLSSTLTKASRSLTSLRARSWPRFQRAMP
ncbi:unnamed protein product [Symbiodinium natans]|uniref:Uncharacterized protein n=1 Tax=Symbiodinium natans TaxID=878477 RepID=A0A812R4A3_9DINO|nr:unnamed protein product [Symbiodinium natans]